MLACSLFFLTSQAQSDTDVETAIKTNGFSNSNAALNYFSSQLQQGFLSNANTSGDNLVYIQQTQDNNIIYSNISAETSDVQIFQDGNLNYVQMNITAKSVFQDVTQAGDRNTYFIDTSLPGKSHSAEVLQQGDQTTVEIYGNNSLSEEMKINVQGNGASVIVRNF